MTLQECCSSCSWCCARYLAQKLNVLECSKGGTVFAGKGGSGGSLQSNNSVLLGILERHTGIQQLLFFIYKRTFISTYNYGTFTLENSHM